MRLLRTLLYQTTLSNIQVSDWETQNERTVRASCDYFWSTPESLAAPPIPHVQLTRSITIPKSENFEKSLNLF